MSNPGWSEEQIRQSLMLHEPFISDFRQWYEDAVVALLTTGKYEGRGIVIDLNNPRPWEKK